VLGINEKTRQTKGIQIIESKKYAKYFSPQCVLCVREYVAVHVCVMTVN
jgi:hypothetical protein